MGIQKSDPLLKEAGHKVFPVDLPGHGYDMTPVSQITLDTYVEKVAKVIDSVGGEVVLVGHSMGGIVVTQTAEIRADKIKTIVYIAAFMPRNGETMMALVEANKESLVFPALTFAKDMSFSFFNRDSAKSVFYNDCSKDNASWATLRLNWQPGAPYLQPLKLTEANFGKVYRIYIKTLQDKAVTPTMQQRMIDASPPDKVIEMDTSHSPFLSRPKELVDHLLTV